MSQSFSVDRHLSFPPAHVFAACTDSDYLREKLAAFGGEGEATVGVSGDDTIVRLPRRLPTDSVPGAFRRVVGDGRVLQIERWRQRGDAYAADWHTEGQKLPGELSGSIALRDDGGGSVYTVTGSISVKMAFVGGTAERLVGDALGRLLDKELEFLDAWLQERRGSGG